MQQQSRAAGAAFTGSNMAVTLKDLNVKLFMDGADTPQIHDMAKQTWIKRLHHNPSLMKVARVSDYASYARELVATVPDRHISFEVFPTIL
jgi:transaldolase